MSVLEYCKGLDLCGKLWLVYILVPTEPPPAAKAVHFGELRMTVAVPSIQPFRGWRGEGRSGQVGTAGARGRGGMRRRRMAKGILLSR